MRVVVTAGGGPIADRCPGEHDAQVWDEQIGSMPGPYVAAAGHRALRGSTVPGLRELRLGRDDGSGAGFIGDPTIPADSAEEPDCWRSTPR